jgi:hypothetical protein
MNKPQKELHLFKRTKYKKNIRKNGQKIHWEG